MFYTVNKLGNNATHLVCCFHLSQNIFKKIQSLDLSSKYTNNPEFNLLTNQISTGLSFLTVDIIWLVCNYYFVILNLNLH